MNCWRGPSGTAFPIVIWHSSWVVKRLRSGITAKRSAWSRAGTRCRSAASRTPPTITRPTTPPTRSPRATAARSWSSAAAPTASGRGSNLTTAACTPRSPSATKGSSRSWSIAIRRPSRPTMIQRTSSISSRSRSKMCSASTKRNNRKVSLSSLAARPRSISPGTWPRRA